LDNTEEVFLQDTLQQCQKRINDTKRQKNIKARKIQHIQHSTDQSQIHGNVKKLFKNYTKQFFTNNNHD